MDLKTLTSMFPDHKLVMGEQFAQESISALKIKAILNWSDTIFVNCDFSETQFHLLMMTSAIFFKCDFSGAHFRACDIDGCEFISCNLTYTDIKGASVIDTSFTDCIIGGLIGPEDFSNCTFVYPRYSRTTQITSPIPYFIITTESDPLYVFKTETMWRIHRGTKHHNIDFSAMDEAPMLYRTAIAYAEIAIQEHLEILASSMAEYSNA
ncbi:pentapeptide repeat-containing protein [Kordiimonas pumila]|uniref:Pentapeptide repeat-containing protein n=1 Tax=Kordiimonas pumila TaxID=2161677 RepID=A0ABV7D5X7_9PROT|nr:pentapeptide repeat-containing protein [Kordiimonas pumila]